MTPHLHVERGAAVPPTAVGGSLSVLVATAAVWLPPLPAPCCRGFRMRTLSRACWWVSVEGPPILIAPEIDMGSSRFRLPLSSRHADRPNSFLPLCLHAPFPFPPPSIPPTSAGVRRNRRTGSPPPPHHRVRRRGVGSVAEHASPIWHHRRHHRHHRRCCHTGTPPLWRHPPRPCGGHRRRAATVWGGRVGRSGTPLRRVRAARRRGGGVAPTPSPLGAAG